MVKMQDSDLDAPQWVLRYWTGSDPTFRMEVVTSLPFQIGRLTENDLKLMDPTVSSRHAELFKSDGQLLVRDLKSTNGSFVNGHRVNETPAPLKNGDFLQLGNVRMQVLLQDQMDSPNTVSIDVSNTFSAYTHFDELLTGAGIIPHFQPVMNLGTKEIIGFEILARSSFPGLETPLDMFRIAAERDQQSELSRILREVGVDTGAQLGDTTMYINTHPNELNDQHLIASLDKLRQSHPELSMILEVHEAAVTSPEYLRELNGKLKELGIGLAYDDFGAGQARLVELCEALPEVIKFDLKLISGLDQASEDRLKVVRTLVNMVLDLGVTPLAEGIETEAVAEVCSEIGIVLGQGYLLGRPAPVTQWIATLPEQD